MTINENDIKQLYSHYSKEGLDYLKRIIKKYEQIWQTHKCEHQLITANKLLKSDLIKIENNNNHLETNSTIKNQLITDGKNYNDNIIHIHPSVCTTSDELFTECEERIYFEIMKLFIKINHMDENSQQGLKNINNYITNGVVAYCMNELNENSADPKPIPEEYEANLEYVKTILDNQSQDIINNLIFNGSVEQILSSNQRISPVELYKDYKSKYPTGKIEQAPFLVLRQDKDNKSGYFSSVFYVFFIIIAGIIIAILLRH